MWPEAELSALCTLEHYWQFYCASYWHYTSNFFTGKNTATHYWQNTLLPRYWRASNCKNHVTGVTVTAKTRPSVNRQLGQLLCRAPECGLFW